MKHLSVEESLVYRFKIQLIGIWPPIWRRIIVPHDYTFSEFHTAIQDAMGWMKSHRYTFEINDPTSNENIEITTLTGMKDIDENVLSSEDEIISDHFDLEENNTAIYTYDLGDSWEHLIKLEKINRMAYHTKYPRCIAGKRACPPENAGGVDGYKHMCKVLKDPNHEEYDEFKEWLKSVFEDVKDDDFEYDPDHFDKKEIVFTSTECYLGWFKDSGNDSD